MKKIITLGHIDLSFHAASAALVELVLQAHGWEVQRCALPHEEMFKKYGSGEVDMLVSAWLPASHELYLAPWIEDTKKITVLYHPYCIWGVPDYIPEDAVSEIADLLRPEVIARMDKNIQGINAGAGISRFSKTMIDAYDLYQAGYHFLSGSQEDCFSNFEQAVAEQRWMIIPLWHPQFLHHRFSIRALHEPKGLLGGKDEATLIAHKSVVEKFEPELVHELTMLTPGNQAISEMDYLLMRENKTAQQAARIWMNNNYIPH